METTTLPEIVFNRPTARHRANLLSARRRQIESRRIPPVGSLIGSLNSNKSGRVAHCRRIVRPAHILHNGSYHGDLEWLPATTDFSF